MSKKVYQVIADLFIAALEQGDLPPWKKSWKTNRGTCKSWYGHEYRGVNAMIVGMSGMPGPFITKNQLKKEGGELKEDQKYIPIIFWKFLKDKKNPSKSIPMIRFFQVYCAQTQCTGLTLPKWALKAQTAPENDFTGTTPVEAFNKVLKAFECPPTLEHGYDHACYMQARDRVELPDVNSFVSAEEYASTGFHELVHSTGHDKRLKRFQQDDGPAMFGSESYSKEELITEIGSAMLLGHVGIDHEPTLENSKAYVKNWLRRLKDDPSLVVWAAGRAQKAVDLITGYIPPKRED